jgi:hypothetical protein
MTLYHTGGFTDFLDDIREGIADIYPPAAAIRKAAGVKSKAEKAKEEEAKKKKEEEEKKKKDGGKSLVDKIKDDIADRAVNKAKSQIPWGLIIVGAILLLSKRR